MGSIEGDFRVQREGVDAIVLQTDVSGLTGLHVANPGTVDIVFHGPQYDASDLRIKAAVREQDVEASLRGVSQLKLRSYAFDFAPNERVVGWLAQEVEGALPDCVRVGPWQRGDRYIPDFRYLNYDRLQAHLTGAVQALARRTEAAEVRADAAEARADATEARLAALEAKLELLTAQVHLGMRS